MSLPNITIKEQTNSQDNPVGDLHRSITPHHWFKGLKKGEPNANMKCTQQFWVREHWSEFKNDNSMQFKTVAEMEDFALWLLEQAEGLKVLEAKMTEKLEAGTHYVENGQFKVFAMAQEVVKEQPQSKPRATSVSSKVAENLTF